ncbi:phosphotransferase [Chryseomicrobium sp. FSL W7-1435]|uniref:phosphotransferase enzyme family protein n=1 Tax=Chryseomicrobium sp. FSL W7-1435 TaxID=2921704 RepID=UPI0031599A0D
MRQEVSKQEREALQMEQWINEMFTDERLAEAAALFGADAKQAIQRGDFENYVYEVEKDGKPFMLRLTHTSHRSKEQVVAELEWVNDLHDRGMNVSLNHLSTAGNLVEEISLEQGSFLVCLFDKAPGTSAYELRNEFTDKHIEAWGELTARFHQAASDYNKKNGSRPHWYEDDLIEIENWLDPELDKEIIELNHHIVSTIRNFDTSKDVYGIIHSDIHQGNFFIDGAELHVFDFDDTMHFHYIHDVSIPLYYTIWMSYRNEPLSIRSEKATAFFEVFYRGYTRIRPLEKEWLERIPLYLTLRDLTLYAVFHKKVDFDEEPELRPLVEWLGERLRRNEPIAEVDFSKLY